MGEEQPLCDYPITVCFSMMELRLVMTHLSFEGLAFRHIGAYPVSRTHNYKVQIPVTDATVGAVHCT
jgi:hypothetical protein